MSKLNGKPISDLHIHLPPAGAWIGHLHLVSGQPPPPGPAKLTLGDLTLTGAILPGRGGADAPAKPSVVVAGGYGWRNLLPAPGATYTAAGGVRLSDVLRDLARIAGEIYDAPAEASLGTSYGWSASTPQRPIRCSAVLAGLVARGALPMWRVNVDGRTRFDAWPALGAADRNGVVSDRLLAFGVREVALAEKVAAWLPGATVQGARIARVTFEEHGGELRARVSDA